MEAAAADEFPDDGRRRNVADSVLRQPKNRSACRYEFEGLLPLSLALCVANLGRGASLPWIERPDRA